ncbi:MAG: 50S ribosomal protein L18 [Lentisphaerae bacterium GWF2_45_14]|nr:MAG: 50S ribosomal protein L18 [Lentisphaerae bacterium GWF2_45_14]
MAMYKTKKEKIRRRHMRIRKKISGSASIPRFNVHVSANHIYIQFIDDVSGRTLAAASSLDPQFKEAKVGKGVAGAEILGKLAAERAMQAGISAVVFDRGGFRFHGKVKALADSARKTGLKF